MKATDENLLRRSSLFQFLPDEHFEQLRALLQEENYEFGDILVRRPPNLSLAVDEDIDR